jgi:hypothetical protein
MTPLSRAVAAWRKLPKRAREDIFFSLECDADGKRESAARPTLNDLPYRWRLLRRANEIDTAIRLLRAAEKTARKGRRER